jgi:hypothetical protein
MITNQLYKPNSLRTDGDGSHKGWDTEIAQKIKHTNMIIHWKALEE